MNLQESGEMYLETIFILSEEMEHVRSIDVAEHMKFSKPSVSRAVALLREGGYLNMDQSGYLTLTTDGTEIARKIYDRHKLISTLLCRIGVSEDIAAADACKIEHVISDETFLALKKYVNS